MAEITKKMAFLTPQMFYLQVFSTLFAIEAMFFVPCKLFGRLLAVLMFAIRNYQTTI